MIYVDSSALVKLVVEQAESVALRGLLAKDADQIASAIVEVEVVRAVRRAAAELTTLAQNVVAQIAVVEPTEAIRARAGLLEPATLRSPDALHLATALEIGDDLDALVTYDGPMSTVAETFGRHVLAPQ